MIKTLAFLGILIAITSCDNQRVDFSTTPIKVNPVDQLLEDARTLKTPEAERSLLKAANLLQEQNKPGEALSLLEQVNLDTLPQDLQVDFITTQSTLALEQGDLPKAKALLNDETKKLAKIYPSLSPEQQTSVELIRADLLELEGEHQQAAAKRITLNKTLSDTALQTNQNAIWRNLTAIEPDTLAALSREVVEPEAQGWLELAWIHNAFRNDIPNLSQRVQNWRRRNPEHAALNYMPEELANLPEVRIERPNNIAVFLPNQGRLAPVAEAIRKGLMSAHYQAMKYSNNLSPNSDPADALTIRFYDSSDAGTFQENYARAVEEGAEMIIGPLEKDNVRYLQQLPQIPVPTLALNYGDDVLDNPAFLYQFGLSAEDEARSAARQAWKHGYQNAGILYPDNDWGNRVQGAFRQEWEAMTGNVLATASFSKQHSMAKAIQELLLIGESKRRAREVARVIRKNPEFTTRRRQDLDFVFVFASPEQGRQINPLFSFYYARELPLLATSHINDGKDDNPELDKDLNTVEFAIIPWLLGSHPEIQAEIEEAWPNSHPRYQGFFALGVDAYNLGTQMQKLVEYPDNPIPGASGRLALDTLNRVQRDLDWAVFEEGQVKELEPLAPRSIPYETNPDALMPPSLETESPGASPGATGVWPTR